MASFDWDQANINHIARHGITPEEAQQVVLNNPIDLALQTREGEQRTPQLGETNAGRLLVVVTTWRRTSIRVVTAFPAKQPLQKLYRERKAGADAAATE